MASVKLLKQISFFKHVIYIHWNVMAQNPYGVTENETHKYTMLPSSAQIM